MTFSDEKERIPKSIQPLELGGAITKTLLKNHYLSYFPVCIVKTFKQSVIVLSLKIPCEEIFFQQIFSNLMSVAFKLAILHSFQFFFAFC